MVWIVRMQGSTVGGGGVPHRDRRIWGYGTDLQSKCPYHPSLNIFGTVKADFDSLLHRVANTRCF